MASGLAGDDEDRQLTDFDTEEVLLPVRRERRWRTQPLGGFEFVLGDA